MRRSTRPTIVPGPSLPTPAAELVVAVTSGRATAKSPDEQTTKHGPTVAELARDWQEVNQPRQQRKTAEWVGWSPKTAVTVADNFRIHILPAIGTYLADQVTGLHLDRLYRSMQVRNGLSASAVLRCHAQIHQANSSHAAGGLTVVEQVFWGPRGLVTLACAPGRPRLATASAAVRCIGLQLPRQR